MCILRKIGFFFFFLALNIQANKKISIFVESLNVFEKWVDGKGLVEASAGSFKVLFNEFSESKIVPTGKLDFYLALSAAYRCFSLELEIIKANNNSDDDIIRYLDGLKELSDDAFNYVSSKLGFEERRRSSAAF